MQVQSTGGYKYEAALTRRMIHKYNTLSEYCIFLSRGRCKHSREREIAAWNPGFVPCIDRILRNEESQEAEIPTLELSKLGFGSCCLGKGERKSPTISPHLTCAVCLNGVQSVISRHLKRGKNFEFEVLRRNLSTWIIRMKYNILRIWKYPRMSCASSLQANHFKVGLNIPAVKLAILLRNQDTRM